MKSQIWNKNFVLLTASNFLMFITYYAVLSTLPLYLVSNFHAGKTIVGLIVSVYTIASVTVRPFSGFALDRFGRKAILYTTLILYAGFYLGYLVALSVAALLLLRIVHGVTWGAVTISNTTQAIDIIPVERKGEGIGYFALSTTLAMSVGPIVGLFFFHQFGYTVMFVTTFIIGLIGFTCVLLTHVPAYIPPKEKVKFNWHNLFDKGSVLPSVNLLIFMLSYGGLISFISLYGKEIGVHNTSLFFLVFALGIAISRFTSGKVFDKHGPRNILSFCSLFLIAGFLVLALFKTVAGFYCASVIIGFGIGVVFPIFQAMVNNLAQPEHRGAANSTVYTALDLGMGMGMLFMGIVSQHTSIATAFMLCSLICLLGLLFFRTVTLVRYEEKVSRLTKTPKNK
jgi:MFS family permease